MNHTLTGTAMRPVELSEEARQAIDTKVISGGWNGRALVTLLGELERWDLAIEAERTATKQWLTRSQVASVVGFMAMWPLIGLGGLFIIGPTTFMAPLIAYFVLKRNFKRLTRANLPNEMRQVIRPVLKQLSQDLHPQARIKVTINLSGVDEERSTSSMNLPPGPNRSLKLSVFEQSVCDVQMPLVDGSTAVLRLQNSYRKLERKYRNPRGKYKSKTKWQKRAMATAMLIPDRSIYWEPASVQPFMETTRERLSFPVKDGVAASRLDRRDKFKTEKEPPEDTIPVEDVIALFVRLAAMRPAAGGAP